MDHEEASVVAAPKLVHVEAMADHLESLARAKPANALAELIWNALDADADRVHINVTDKERLNKLVARLDKPASMPNQSCHRS